jgi:hypothetical protein
LLDGKLSVHVYSGADRLLHKVALGFKPVAAASFDLEVALFGNQAKAYAASRPVFVSSLARSGTTFVVRLLLAQGNFASLTYRDLPFPLAPNINERLFGRSRLHIPLQQRDHADGLAHDLDSPEAIEEVFWRVVGQQDFDLKGVGRIPSELASFGQYMALTMLRYGKQRYLSKNNANATRVGKIAEYFPSALFVHPFRDPIQQSASLLRQHRLALESHERDPFRTLYMRWLGHHDFGAEHKPIFRPDLGFRFPDTGTLNYWLELWIATYAMLIKQAPALAVRQLFWNFDTHFSDLARSCKLLSTHCGITIEVPPSDAQSFLPPAYATECVDLSLKREAYELYLVLTQRATSYCGDTCELPPLSETS